MFPGWPIIPSESQTVSIDKSLKRPAGIVRSRNVLKRGERIDQLLEEGRWHEGESPLGLPKVRVERAVTGKKKKKMDEEGEGEGEGEGNETSEE